VFWPSSPSSPSRSPAPSPRASYPTPPPKTPQPRRQRTRSSAPGGGKTSPPTYVEETAYIGAGIGSWVPTGERTADLIIVFQDLDGGLDPSKPAAFAPGTITFRLAVSVDETGNNLIASGPQEVRSPDGTLLDTLTFDFLASRVTTDWTMPSPAQATPAPAASPPA
jgi:hypothetical protein